jgi:uncharacterized protein YndB with AHSA1/START domain
VIDVVHEINAEQRKVAGRTLDAGDARTIIISRTYRAPVEDVWDACTNPERIPRWFLPVTGDLQPGGRFELKGNAAGTIEHCQPPTTFTATWEFGGDVTWIELRLSSEEDGRTRLELEHIARVGDDRWAEFGPGALGVGWDLGLLGLGRHLTTGATIDPAEAAVWSASSEGRAFIAGSSQSWEQASVTAGTDRGAARAAAERTTAFYTGDSSAV